MSKKKLGMVITFGPELKSFVYSGLLDLLKAKYNITIFTFLKDNDLLQNLLHVDNVIIMPKEKEGKLMAKCRYISQRLHVLWMEKNGPQKWDHYLKNSKRRLSKEILDVFLFYMATKSQVRLFFKIEETLGRILGTNAQWAKLFYESGIEGLIASDYADARTLPLLQTAKNLGVKIIIIPNSWKDIYTRPHMPLIPDSLFLWSKSNEAMFLSLNPWLTEDHTRTVGSLHLERFLATVPPIPKKNYYGRMGLDERRLFICYTAAAPKAVKNEAGIVEGLLEGIKQGAIPGKPQVLLRLNPMEDGRRFHHLLLSYPTGLILQKPLWDWRPDQDWCAPREEDSDLWLATVFYASLNISIPSTVTLEFVACGKPVVNVCFDTANEVDKTESNRRFWEAPFYSEIVQRGMATPAFSLKEFFKAVSDALAGKTSSGQEQKKKVGAWIPPHAAKTIRSLVEEMF